MRWTGGGALREKKEGKTIYFPKKKGKIPKYNDGMTLE